MVLSLQLLNLARIASIRTSYSNVQSRFLSSTSIKLSDSRRGQDTSDTENPQSKSPGNSSNPDTNQPAKPKKAKSTLQADAELQEKLEQKSGEGGAAGIEYEDGKPNTMKRSVRNNMFRYI